jgi:membrane protease subunit HflC
MHTIRSQVNEETDALGVDSVDVRIKRVDLPEANMQAIYRRMQTERQREAAEFRAEGEGASRRIRGTADREVTVLKAEATGESERIRGEGDAERNRIFAEAFEQDPDFFAFYRSMQAYEGALKAGDTRLLLSPDSQFFQYFSNAFGRTGTFPPTGEPATPPETPAVPESGESAMPDGGVSPPNDASAGNSPPQAPQSP